MEYREILEKADPAVCQAMNDELARQRDHIELIASENFVSPAVMAAVGSHLTNKYAEGYPGHRYYGGCEYVDVIEDIARVFPATIELGTISIIIGAGLGIPLGVTAAVRRNKLADYVVRFFSLLAYSTPTFWVGLMGLLLFYAFLGWSGGTGRVEIFYADLVQPITGFLLIDSAITGEWDVFWSALRNIWLPAAVLGLNSMAYIARMTRSFMIDQLGQEYVVTARIKGLSRNQVIWRHAFRNIRVQLVTIVALAYGGLLEGAVLIETVFSWPGFGGYLTSNLMIGDLNAVMACTLIVGVLFIALNILSDLLYRVFDPRTRAA